MINYIYGLIFVIVISTLGYCYKLYNDNIVLELNNTTLNESLVKHQQLLEKTKLDLAESNKLKDVLQDLTNKQNQEISDLRSVFTKEKNSSVFIDNKEYKIKITRDIGKLAIKKPILVQTAINKGTMNIFNCLELVTNKDYKGDYNECK